MSTSISTIIPFCLSTVAKLPKQKNKAKTLFQICLNCAYQTYTRCFIGSSFYFVYIYCKTSNLFLNEQKNRSFPLSAFRFPLLFVSLVRKIMQNAEGRIIFFQKGQ